MKIIFFGLGSIGLRHAAILQRLGAGDLYAFRTFKGQRDNELGIKEVTRWSQVEKIKPDVAFITNPTALHIDTAIECARRNMHLFIEKPLGSDPAKLPQLLKIVKTKKLSSYVGYVLRFHPAILGIKTYLRDHTFYHMRIQTTSFLHRWRPGTDPLKSYSAKRAMGGGVIYELSHELDYIQFLLGDIKSIKGIFNRRSRLTVDAEDFADMLVETEKGPVNVHVDFFSEREQRKVQVDMDGLSIEADLITNKIVEFKGGKFSREHGFDGATRDCYEPQIRYFLSNLHNPKMMNNISEAAELFKKIYQFKKNGARHAN